MQIMRARRSFHAAAMKLRLLMAALIAAMLCAACGELSGGTGQISRKIGDIARDPAAKEVDLGKLTSFGWDRFYFFKAGTTREEICQFISADRNQCGRVIRYPVVPAESMALLFGLQGQLTHVELHALKNGQFDLLLGDNGHPREASVFRIRRGVGNDAIWLEPK
jgi:hypothetical protein